MELDDFKTAWSKDDQRNITRESFQKRIDRLEKSGRKIRSAFMMELAIIGAICVFFVALIIIFNTAMQTFMYKLAGITLVGFLPTVYRLYHSQQWINTMDYATDVRSNLLAFLTYYKATIKWYWWSSFIISALMFIILFTDKDFLGLGVAWQIGTCAYVIVILLLTPPYLRKVYGKHVKEFEKFLE